MFYGYFLLLEDCVYVQNLVLQPLRALPIENPKEAATSLGIVKIT
jgi:hypothetical protein